MPSRRHSILKVCVTTPMRGRPADDHWMVTSPLDTAQELHWRLSHYMRELTLQRDNAVIAADRLNVALSSRSRDYIRTVAIFAATQGLLAAGAMASKVLFPKVIGGLPRHGVARLAATTSE
jgi:hypothetical protein